MGAKSDTADFHVARIAARQHGVVTRRQLERCGLGSKAITIRVRKGQLNRAHQGVYAVGHRGLSLHGRFMAAVLACGSGAVLSHTSAAVLWKLLRPIDGPIHVSIPTTSGRKRRRGVNLHRCPSLNTPAEPSPSPSSLPIRGGRGRRLLTTHRDGIPVTIVPRTIEDLQCTSLPPRLIRRAKRQAELKGYRLDGVASDRTRSDLETLFLELCARHRLPPPEVNVELGNWEVDFLWRAQRVVVETDYWIYHRGSVAFEDDHARDLDLRAAGYTVLRFTDRQLAEEPGRVVADVARALAEEVSSLAG
ncbi:MAG TPA: type IV toxin-antitoxin system AbiEi family antitoxin domain-containing protein [Solirubrobacterales bacterium]|nr:type IV toxin-antitoxin system AbiEi family antitoxin domain-containing protein [Solirubrobacterales bacterium]